MPFFTGHLSHLLFYGVRYFNGLDINYLTQVCGIQMNLDLVVRYADPTYTF